MTAPRSVNVRLLISSAQFNQGMIQAGSSVRVLAQSLGTTQQQAQAANQRLAELSKTGLIVGGTLTGAFAYGAKVFMDFDKQMSAAGAAAGATGADLAALREAAIKAGKDTAFSATEAAEGIEELAKAGVSAADITGGALTGALNLAAAGGVSVADAAETAASAMTVFGLSGRDVGHIADVLAAGAGKAQGGVEDMSQAFSQSALVAKQTGLSIEDTAGALAMFASNGLIGSDAGTSFKTMLMSLNPRSAEAAKLMDQLGLSAYDQQGNFIGLAEYADRLQKGLSGLSTEQRNAALQTIFGTDAIRAASILYSEGATGVQQWASAVDDSGYAAEQGAARMDNLSGDLEKLRGSIESAILDSGSAANEVLRDMAQKANDVVAGFMALPPVVQQSIVGFVGVAGVGITAASGLGLLFSKLNSLKATLMAGGPAAQRFAGAIGMMKSGAVVAAAALAAFTYVLQKQGEEQQKANDLIESYSQALKDDTGAIGAHTKAQLADNLAKSGAIAAGEKLGLTADILTQAALGNADALGQVAAATDGNVSAMEKILAPVIANSEAMKAQAGIYGDTASASSALGVSTDGTAKSMAAATTIMKDQQAAANSLKDALDELSGKKIDSRQSEIDMIQSTRELTQTILDNAAATDSQGNVVGDAAKALGDNSEAALKNEDAILGLIEKTNQHAQTKFDETHKIEDATAVLGADRDMILAAADAAGLNRDKVQEMIDKYMATPETIATRVVVDTAGASTAISDFVASYNGVSITIPVKTKAEAANLQQAFDSMSPDSIAAGHYAGGYVTGPGTGTSDSIPAMLSNGEYVIKASAVQKIGVDNLNRLNGTSENFSPVMYTRVASASAQPSAGGPADMAGLAGRIEQLERTVARGLQEQTAVLTGATERQTRTLARPAGMPRRSGE